MVVPDRNPAADAPDKAHEAAGGAPGSALAALIVRSATDFAIITSDLHNIITSWSPGAEAMMGWTAREAVGRRVDLFFTPEDVAVDRPARETECARAEGWSADERWHVKRDGTRFWASGELQPLIEHGEVVGFVKIVRDRTEQHELQQQLQAAKAQAQEANDRLAADQKRLRSLFAAAPGFIAVLRGPDHVFEFANASYNRLVGHRRLIGRPVREALPEIEGQGFGELLDQVYTTGERATAAQQPIMLRGEASGALEQRFVSFVYEPIRDPDGRVAGIFVEGFDETDAALARSATDKIAAEQAAVLGQLAEGVIATDASGRITFVNSAAERLHGVARVDLGHADYGDTYHLLTEDGQPYPAAELPLSRAVEHGEVVHDARWRIRRPDGSEVLAVGNAQPVIVDDRQIGAVLTVRDDTERARAEAAVRETEERYRLATAATTDAVWDWDLRSDVIVWNDAVHTVFGYRPDEVDLAGAWWIGHIHPDDRERVDIGIHAVIDGAGTHWSDEYRFRRADGSYANIFDRGAVIRDASGRATRMIGAMLDLTDRKKAEDALRAETETLETLNGFFAEVAGELDLERVVQMVTDAGRGVTGADYGAFFYNRTAEAGAMLLYTLSGAERSQFEHFGMPRATAIFHPTLSGEGPVRSEDITQDPRYGLNDPHHGMPEGHLPMRSYLAVPVISRSGQPIGGLFFGHREAGRFDARHERLLVGIAGQAATAIDNARLFEAAQHEIAERRRTQDALAASEARLNAIANSIDQMIWSTRPDGYHDYFNQRWYDFTGMPPGSTDGEEWSGMFHPDDQDQAWALWRHSLETGEPYQIEYRLRHRSGQYRWVLGRAQATRGEDGRIDRWYGTCTDIHDFKVAEDRRKFLLSVNDALRDASEGEGPAVRVAATIGQYLGVARAGYGDIDATGEIVRVESDWVANEGVQSLAGESRVLDAFGPDVIAELRAGRTLVVDDCLADARVGAGFAETWRGIGCRALVVVPLIRDGALRALLYLHEPEPRRWTRDEVAIAEEVGQRTWDAVARARAEDALRASEAQYRTLFEAIDAGFCIVEVVFDEAGRPQDYVFLEINPAFERQTGLSEAAGRSIRELVPGIEQHWIDMYGGVAMSGQPLRFENGAEAMGRWFDVFAFPVGDPGSRQVALLFNEISERRNAESALRRLNETLEARVAAAVAERDLIWSTSQDLFVICGFDGAYQSVNPAWTTLLGYNPDELVGRKFDALVHPDDMTETIGAFETLMRGELMESRDIRLRARDGSYRWISWTAVPQGDLFSAAGRDITARKELEEQLRQAQKMEAVGQLTGGIAHDFNNLLTIVSGNIDMAKRTLGPDGNARALRSLENAAKGADRAAALTQRLLAFSRRQPLQPRETNVNKLLAGMSELLDRALGETVDLQIATDPGVWRVEVDPNQLENAILNLAVNARDAMPAGGKLTIETTNSVIDAAYAAAQREVVPGQYVLISVTDTGEGMPPEVVAKAFDPFFSTKEVGKGTGLGLSQVYGYVKQSGGHVKIYSEAGQGTTIKLYLPRLVAASNAAEEEQGDAGPALQGRESILVVEDDDDVRIYTVDSLRELGYRVLEAHDGASALRLLERQEEAPQLLLTDVVMPGMSGRELADKARATWPKLRVLFTTGYARNAIVHAGRLDAGVELLPKPFTYEALAAKIRDVLDKGG